MKKIIPLLFCLCFSGLLQAQNKPDSVAQLKQTYKDYFQLNREAVFLQLNKTKVLPKEDLWFSAYVYDPRVMKPNLKTTNLHVNIYDSQGKLKKAKTVFINDGKGAGYFKLDVPNFKPGNYLVKAFTKYMDNFSEDLTFTQGFKILGDTTKNTKKGKPRFDLQLLPEGGHLLANAQNTIGVKLIDDRGKEVFFTEAKVVNTKGKTLTTFKSNRFGMAKFDLKVEPGERYTVKVTPKGAKTVSVKLQHPDLHGLAFSVNNLLPNKTFLSVRTNPSTLKDIAGQKFYIAYHRQGVLGTIPFVFPKDRTEVTLQIKKKYFASGVDVLTLFDHEFNPLLERQVFYAGNLKRKRVNAHFFKNRGDSLIINLSSKLKQGKHALSISVLPGETKAYTPDNGIISAFYIEPFIKGNLKHGSYYFSDGQERRKAYDLDLLLLTQGWSKYRWRNVFKGTPTEYYGPEHGFIISGQVSKRDKETEKRIFIKGRNKSQLFETAFLDAQNHFKVDKLFVRDTAKISFGLMNSKKKKIKQPPIYAKISPQRDIEGLSKMPKNAFDGLQTERPIVEGNLPSPKNFIRSAQVLDSVFIKGKRKIKRRNNDRAYGIVSKRTLVDEEMANSYIYITDFIATKGFRVYRSMTAVSITTQAALSLRGSAHPKIVLDRVPLGGNLEPLTTLLTSEVKSITINKTGLGGGITGTGGIITITTKAGSFVDGGKPSETTRTIKMKNGFAANKEFYIPKYSNYVSDTFLHFGTIGWFPKVKVDASGTKTLKISNTLQPSVKLFIQGMTADGSLISEELTVKTP